MSQNKKYYWLKLNSDFFDDETIKYIEEQENGIKYSNFYLKLCLKSLKTEGKLIRLVGETLLPYDINSLSKLTGVDFDTVRCAMELFTQIGLIKILDSGEIYLSQINEMIGSETDKAKMMRLKRATNVDLKGNGNNVTQMLPKCYPEIEIDIEKEIEIEKRNKKEKKFTKPSAEEIKAYCLERHNSVDYQRFYDFYEAKGWMVGKNKMKDWKAAVRTWEKDKDPPKNTFNADNQFDDLSKFYAN